MGIWRSIAGSVCIEVTSADIPGALKLLTENNILLQDITYKSDLCVCAMIRRADYAKTEELLTARGDACKPRKRLGIFWTLSGIKRRPLLFAGMLILLILTILIPSRILFIQVHGNETVPSHMITEKARMLGLYFGCSRSDIKGDQLKNLLLEALPELDWVGITTAGCVATIDVKEKNTNEQERNNANCVSSLVASCDGVVESITVTSGTALCQPGQAVYRGQVLISGYEDLGLLIKATDAEGEVYARTYRYIQAITPIISSARTFENGRETKFSLQIGKKLINFFQDSGISPIGCVKMYSKKFLTLPGGFQLPVALVTETLYHCDLKQQKNDIASFSWMKDFADSYICEQMIGGELISQNISSELLDEIFVLSAQYACREQIGQKRNEESLYHNG